MLVVQLARIAWLSHLPTGLLVQRIPDDAFYYLVLAKNFAAHGRWTFDGVAPSSGFHLLWGYMLALLFAVAPRLGFHAVFALCSTFAALLMSVATFWTAAAAQRLFGSGASWSVALVLLSAVSLVQATWLMESPLVLFFAAACVAQLAFADDDAEAVNHLTKASTAVACLLGFMGSLARSDFGLLPFWLAVGCVASAWVGKASPRRRLAIAQLLGASAGVVLIFGHTYWVSHHLTQSSAQVKLWWAHFERTPWRIVFGLPENLLNPTFNHYNPSLHWQWIDMIGVKVRQVVALLIVVGLALYVRKFPRLQQSFLLLAMAAACASYLLLYRMDGATQDWYEVNFAVPVCLLAAGAWSMVPGRWRMLPQLVVVAMSGLALLFSVRAHAPWQEATYRSALQIVQHPGWRPVGTWNAGVMSYFSGGGVVNLDGLVNDDLLPFIKRGTLVHYIGHRHVAYVIESPNILGGELAERSGIGDGALARCVDQRTTLFPDDPLDNAYGMHLQLIHFDPACMQATSH